MKSVEQRDSYTITVIFFSLQRKLSSFNDKGPHVSLIKKSGKIQKRTGKEKTLVPLLPKTIMASMLVYFLLLCFGFLSLLCTVSVFVVDCLPPVLSWTALVTWQEVLGAAGSWAVVHAKIIRAFVLISRTFIQVGSENRKKQRALSLRKLTDTHNTLHPSSAPTSELLSQPRAPGSTLLK